MRQELTQQANEDSLRVSLRNELKTHNKNLASTAEKAKVTNYGQFTDAGYTGLYGGMRQSDIHKAKKLTKTEKILDHMGSEDLLQTYFVQHKQKQRSEEKGL
jgi:DNA-damage-inducible protein D